MLHQRAIEFNLTQHCNLRCAWCDHASPFLPADFSEVESLERDLGALREVMRVDEIKLVGGEPLLHPRLADFVRVARDAKIAGCITVVTNGTLLHRMDTSVLDLIDRLSVSIYPGFEPKVDLEGLRAQATAAGTELTTLRVETFRKTLIDEARSREDPEQERTTRRIYKDCGMAHRWSCHTILEGRYYKCSPAPFLEPRMAAREIEVNNRERDGVALHGGSDLHGRLRAYLKDRTPLEACRFCLGSSGPEAQHAMLEGPRGREPEALVAAGAQLRPDRLGQRRWIWSALRNRK